jgi:uncharacterized membrane protein
MDKDALLKISTQTALAGLLALSLTSCSKPTTPDSMVKCYGVAQGGASQWVATTAGQCKKLADSKAVPMTDAEAAQAPRYQATDYVKCYGVAAAGMNDCGTKTTACGGTIATARSKIAWISIPKAICQQVKGGIVGKAK